MILVLLLGNLFLKKESMGMGDVKLSGLIGFVIGLPLFFVSVWLSSIVGTIYGVFWKTKMTQTVKIPFGAILVSISTLILLCRELIEEYFLIWIN